LEDGCPYAAYVEAERVLEENPRSRQACAIQQRALAALDLEDTPVWMKLLARVDELPG